MPGGDEMGPRGKGPYTGRFPGSRGEYYRGGPMEPINEDYTTASIIGIKGEPSDLEKMI
ncbi:MAG: hypothetical protein KKC75_01775 [Nanoarchaeota archaeon]|nr:hypothetical protein [Nanoarchaeota archaeon]MBU1005736.1 hypothetical protein [Nanoarchaeota archaeon]MBU1945579.1 hypothetical protein [Nanoarchaeota archaeon]